MAMTENLKIMVKLKSYFTITVSQCYRVMDRGPVNFFGLVGVMSFSLGFPQTLDPVTISFVPTGHEFCYIDRKIPQLRF